MMPHGAQIVEQGIFGIGELQVDSYRRSNGATTGSLSLTGEGSTKKTGPEKSANAA